MRPLCRSLQLMPDGAPAAEDAGKSGKTISLPKPRRRAKRLQRPSERAPLVWAGAEDEARDWSSRASFR
jgi:hypothetical protein